MLITLLTLLHLMQTPQHCAAYLCKQVSAKPQVNIPRLVKLADRTWLGRLLMHAFHCWEVPYVWSRSADEDSGHDRRMAVLCCVRAVHSDSLPTMAIATLQCAGHLRAFAASMLQ